MDGAAAALLPVAMDHMKALCCSGVISIPTACHLLCRLGQLMHGTSGVADREELFDQVQAMLLSR